MTNNSRGYIYQQKQNVQKQISTNSNSGVPVDIDPYYNKYPVNNTQMNSNRMNTQMNSNPMNTQMNSNPMNTQTNVQMKTQTNVQMKSNPTLPYINHTIQQNMKQQNKQNTQNKQNNNGNYNF